MAQGGPYAVAMRNACYKTISFVEMKDRSPIYAATLSPRCHKILSPVERLLLLDGLFIEAYIPLYTNAEGIAVVS